MSQVCLLLRDSENDWSGVVSASHAERVIAALSADPVTRIELESAIGRFAKAKWDRPFLANLSLGHCAEVYGAGLVVVDLVARLVAVDSTCLSPSSRGEVCYHDGNSATTIWLPYLLADDWLLTSDATDWSLLATNRRSDLATCSMLNVREVLYGRPLLEFITSETFRAYTSQKPAGKDVACSALQAIHADWLLASRDDLGGACPREVALRQHEHLMGDLQNQSRCWSPMKECPPGLDQASFAFQFGGFGTHEWVEYYGMVRELLWSCWDRLSALEESAGTREFERFTVDMFVIGEIDRLERLREEWLDAPDWELYGRTPRSIIDRERARLPEVASAREAMIDPDCPVARCLPICRGQSFGISTAARWMTNSRSICTVAPARIGKRGNSNLRNLQKAWTPDAKTTSSKTPSISAHCSVTRVLVGRRVFP